MSNNSRKSVLVICPYGQYGHLPLNIHIGSQIQILVYLRSGVKVQEKVVYKNMSKIGFQSNKHISKYWNKVKIT